MEMIEIPVEKSLHADVQQILAKEGLTISEAVDMFLRSVVHDQSPTAIYRVPNAETLAAIREAEEGNLAKASTVEEFFRMLNEDD